jgi:hypothetical protein
MGTNFTSDKTRILLSRGSGAVWKSSPMQASEEFLRHAIDCEQMAKVTRDPSSKATWNDMAVRWRRCAKIAEQNIPPPRTRRESRPLANAPCSVEL